MVAEQPEAHVVGDKKRIHDSEKHPGAAKRKRRKKVNAEKPARSLRREERRDLLAKAKTKWESMRPKATGKEKSAELARELYALLKGRLQEFVFRHDGSRIVQWLLTSHDKETQEEVLTELLSEERTSLLSSASDATPTSPEDGTVTLFSRLVGDRYARHLAVKVMVLSYPPKRNAIFTTHVLPHVASLVRQVHGALVLDTMYSTLLNSNGRIQLVLAILFSREPLHWEHMRKAMFDKSGTEANENDKVSSMNNASNALIRALSYITEEFQSAVIESAYEVVAALMEKETLLPLEMTHATIREWLMLAMQRKDVERVRALASSISAQLVHFAHTKAGLWVSLTCIKVVDAKHRKKMIRSIRGHIRKLVLDEFGHRVIIAMQEWVDDTRLLGKVMSVEACTTERVTPDINTDTAEAGNDGDRGAEEVNAESGQHRKSRGGLTRAEKKKKAKEQAQISSAGNATIGSDNEKVAESEDGIDVDWLFKMCTHKDGRMPLLQLLFGRDTRYFQPSRYDEIWKRLDEETFGKTSKKDDEVRRRELRAWVVKGVCTVIRLRNTDLLQNLFGGPVVVGAAAHEETRDSVKIAVVGLLGCDERLREVCRSKVGRRTLGAVFKVGGNYLAQAVLQQLGVEVVKKIAAFDGCFTLVRYIANVSDNDVEVGKIVNRISAVGENCSQSQMIDDNKDG